jgi:hypothetical protein
MKNSREHQRTRSIVLAAGLAALAAPACDSPDNYLPFQQFGGPAGVLEGTLTYSGPMPCTKDQRIVGAAVLLAFNVNLLPPPAGLGTSAASLGVVAGEKLFEGIRDKLTFNPNGELWCPPHRYVIGASPKPLVTVTAPWAIAPLGAGTYQVRGFYDIDGDFDPAFSISNLPTRGDIGGGAIENAPTVLLGGAPRYRELPLGDLQADGSRVIGENGARLGGIAVTLGLELPLERPVFYAKEVMDAFEGNTNPNLVTLRSDFQLNNFAAANPGATEKSFIRLRLASGVAPEEAKAGAGSPFNLPVDPPSPFVFTQQDVNGDGKLSAIDHVPETEAVPALYPLSIFAQIHEEEPGAHHVERPTVVLQGLTLYGGLLPTVGLGSAAPPIKAAHPEVIIALRPAALCLHAGEPDRPGLLVVSHETDTMGNNVLPDPEGVKAALGIQFKRPIEIAFGCLPEGKYAMNLIYPTGQAWTTPNEAAVCSHLEVLSKDGTMCGTRPRLASQAALLVVGPPKDPGYCSKAPGAAKIKAECSVL